jgi:hypothetical protein
MEGKGEQAGAGKGQVGVREWKLGQGWVGGERSPARAPAACSTSAASAVRSTASWACPMTLNALRTFMKVARTVLTSMAATFLSCTPRVGEWGGAEGGGYAQPHSRHHPRWSKRHEANPRGETGGHG